MNTRNKFKIENIIFTVFIMLGFGAVGGIFGNYLIILEKHMGREIKFYHFLFGFALVIIFSILFFMINIYLHEIGHCVFGALTGYQFSSIRFGSLMLIKSQGKVKLKKYKLPGTAGQALMLAPGGDLYDFPVILYNLGGLFVNLLLGVICSVIYAFLEDKDSVAAIFVLLFAVLSFTVFVTNALPLKTIGTDGANALILYKSRDARMAFRKSLEINKLLSDNVSIKDMPEDLFEYDKSMKLDNPFAASLAVNRFSYFLTMKQFEKAKELGEYILAHASSINYIHETLIKSELIFMALVIDDDCESAKKIFEKEKKMIHRLSGNISVRRMLYAYYSLCEIDEKKAQNNKKMFEQLGKSYPYEEDFKSERYFFDMIDEKIDNKKLENGNEYSKGSCRMER